MHEFKKLAILTVYLYVTIGVVILYKTAVLHGQGISFVPWGIAIVKALLLAKFILIGRAMGVGERYTDRPLIWPTLYKAFALLVLLVVLTVVEEVVVGLIHHRAVAASLGDLAGARLYEFVAGILILLLVLIPYCAIGVLSESLGEGRLARMFFVDRGVAAGRHGRDGVTPGRGFGHCSIPRGRWLPVNKEGEIYVLGDSVAGGRIPRIDSATL